MFRKTLIALAATASLGVAALAPTSASAFGGHGRGGFHMHGGFHGFNWGYRPGFRIGLAGGFSDCYLVKQHTRWGIRYVKVCY